MCVVERSDWELELVGKLDEDDESLLLKREEYITDADEVVQIHSFVAMCLYLGGTEHQNLQRRATALQMREIPSLCLSRLLPEPPTADRFRTRPSLPIAPHALSRSTHLAHFLFPELCRI